MQQSKPHTYQCQCFIKFIDLLLELYSHISHDIRSEMRSLQKTLIYGSHTDLEDYMNTLHEKLELKNNYKNKQSMLKKKQQEKIRNQVQQNLELARSYGQNKPGYEDTNYLQIILLGVNSQQQPLISSSNDKIKEQVNKNNQNKMLLHDFGKICFLGQKQNKENQPQNIQQTQSFLNSNYINLSSNNHKFTSSLSVRLPSECSERKLKKMNSSKIKDEIMSKSKSKNNVTKSCKNLDQLDSNDQPAIENTGHYTLLKGQGIHQRKKNGEKKKIIQNSHKFISVAMKKSNNSHHEKRQEEQALSLEGRDMAADSEPAKICKSISMKTLNTKKISTISNGSAHHETICNQNSTNTKNTLKIVRKNAQNIKNVNKNFSEQSNKNNNKNQLHSARQREISSTSIHQLKQKNFTSQSIEQGLETSRLTSPHIFADLFKQNIDQLCQIMEQSQNNQQIMGILSQFFTNNQYNIIDSMEKQPSKIKQKQVNERLLQENSQNNKNLMNISSSNKQQELNQNQKECYSYPWQAQKMEDFSCKEQKITREKIMMNFYR